MSVDLTAPCIACGQPMADHRRADGRSIACRGVDPRATAISRGFAKLGLVPYSATDLLPAACGWRELCRVFQIGEKQFYKLAGQGAFVAFELHPAIGPRKYSGDRLMRYLRGESVPLSDARALTRLRLARRRA